MSTAFPTALDNFPDPNPTATLAVNGHSAMHTNLNDAIEALEVTVGVTNSADVNSINYKVNDVPAKISTALDAHSSSANPHSQYPTVDRMIAAEALNASLSAAFDFSTSVTYSSIATVLTATGTSGNARDITFDGWGERYSLPGVSFNALKIRTISRTVTTQASKWRKLKVAIRTGSNSFQAGSLVVATAETLVAESSDVLTDVIFLLKDPFSGLQKTLSNADFTGGEYMICVWAENSSGGYAACGEPRGTQSNNLGQSYYVTPALGNPYNSVWYATTLGVNYRLGFDHLLLMNPISVETYAGPSSAFATALADMAYPVPEIIVPPYIFACEGRECNVYFDNLHVSAIAAYEHNVDTSTSVGKQQNERFTWVPSGSQASGTITIDVYHPRSGVKVNTKTAQLRAAAASAGTGVTRKLIVVGDSLVNAGVITQTLLDISGSDAMHVTSLGTQGTGPNNHEGRGGWTINQYVTSGSPFYISGAVNFPQYLTNNSIAVPDWVLVALGINDCFVQTSDVACSSLADTELTKLDTLITSIKAAGAGVKVGLVLPSPPSFYAESFGENYATGQTRSRFKRNILIWSRQMIARYTGQEASRIYLIPSNTALDTVNNMSTATVAPVNSRSSVTTARQNNGVHPGTSGYQQIADAIWAFIKVQG